MTVITFHFHFWWYIQNLQIRLNSLESIIMLQTQSLFQPFVLKGHSCYFLFGNKDAGNRNDNICKLTLFFAFLMQNLEIFCKNLNKPNIRFQCLGWFDIQYFALIENVRNRADTWSVCLQYLSKKIIQIFPPWKLLLKCIHFYKKGTLHNQCHSQG